MVNKIDVDPLSQIQNLRFKERILYQLNFVIDLIEVVRLLNAEEHKKTRLLCINYALTRKTAISVSCC